MPIPGLIDIYAFTDWLKKHNLSVGSKIEITIERGGLCTIKIAEKEKE